MHKLLKLESIIVVRRSMTEIHSYRKYDNIKILETLRSTSCCIKHTGKIKKAGRQCSKASNV